MDDLDITNTLSPSFPWLPYTASEFSEHQINGGNGDIGYLTQRSVMLEPIIEETSDDDDVSGGPGGHVWSHYDNQWSSESETGSVIRVELIQEADTVSERDFACPPKRRKQDECDDEVVLRKPMGNTDDYKYRIDLLDPPTESLGKRFRLEDTNFDRYSDPDSLSFNSLSRSSSLIQFESLERQIQTSDANTFGGSTPSIHNQLNDSTSKSDAFIGADGCNAPGTCEKNGSCDKIGFACDKSEFVPMGSSMRCYYDLDKIDFNSSLFLNCREQSSSETSSSTDNSIYYSEDARESDADLKEGPVTSGDTMLIRGSFANSSNGSSNGSSGCGGGRDESRRPANPRCKNSVENLSEDSGYGDFPSIKNRSKSIPNLINQDQSLIEEDEESTHNDSAHKSFDNICCHYNRTSSSISSAAAAAAAVASAAARTHSNEIHSRSNRDLDATDNPKIDAISVRSASFGAAKNSFTEHIGLLSSSSSSSSSGAPSHTTICRKSSSDSSSNSSQANSMSASLPDLCNHFSIFGDADATPRTNTFCNANCGRHSTSSSKSKRISASRRTSSPFEKDLFIVSSVPSDLNYFAKYPSDGASADDRSRNECERDETDCWNFSHRNAVINSSVWPQTQASVATKNYCDLGHSFGSTETAPAAPFYLPPQQSFRQQKIINSSYSNLTILDYSSRGSSCSSFTGQLRMMADKAKRHSNASSRSGSGEFSRCNFLLDEISAHFDRNLSILNDKNENTDSGLLTKDWFSETKESTAEAVQPPQPPPRKLKSPSEEVKRPARAAEKSAKLSLAPSSPDGNELESSPNTSFSFDRDPTNLKTCYADSLERCNFDIGDSATSIPEIVDRSVTTTVFTPPKHSTPVKREMVVSTPNLFLHKSEPIEEDFRQVASTHNSLNPLPQADGMAEKTKGILAGGSRNSLGKGVSFYPFVSEISWREQSSNEDAADDEEGSDSDNESHNKHFNDMTNNSTGLAEASTNTQNIESSTAPSGRRIDRIEPPSESVAITGKSAASNINTAHDTDIVDDEFFYETQPRSLAALAERDRRREQLYLQRTKQQQLAAAAATVRQASNSAPNEPNAIEISRAKIVNEKVTTTVSIDSQQKQRTVSVKCDDGSDLNRAKQEISAKTIGVSSGASTADAASDSNNSNDKKRKMEKSKIGAGVVSSPNNAPDKLAVFTKTEKKNKPGFLSRFSGFRFSLRGSKKKLKSLDHPAIGGNEMGNSNNIVLVSKSATIDGSMGQTAVRQRPNETSGRAGSYQRNSMRSNDFVYIPLKEPSNGAAAAATVCVADKSSDKRSNGHATPATTATPLTTAAAAPAMKKSTNASDATHNADKKHVLTGKPPLPKQPPRVVGVCAKQPASVRHAHQQRSMSAPREIQPPADGKFYHGSDNDGNYDDDVDFYYNQLRSGSRRLNQTIGSGMMTSAVSSDGMLLDESAYTEDSFCTNDTDADDSRHGGKIGLIETNLDTDETIISGKTRSLMELGPQQLSIHRMSGGVARRLHGRHAAGGAGNGTGANVEPRRPHKSMEFLLDKENQKFVLPPENELQKLHDNNSAISEHQLRVQASLQRLNIPEWFRQYSGGAGAKPAEGTGTSGGYVPGSFTKKRTNDANRWAGLNSKTTSLSSLGSHRSDRSPLLLSPSAQSHHGQTGFSRWSTSHLNSSQTSPSASTRSSFTRGGPNASILSGQSFVSGGNDSIRASFRKPYLGWRSQEKLSQPRTPHERLASSMLTRQQGKQQSSQSSAKDKIGQETKVVNESPAVTQEIQSSIKEVTSAIVHFVNDQRAASSNSRSRSTSPSSKNCWLESSFVGNRPLDSPQTPVIETLSPREINTQGVSISAGSNRVNGVVTPIPVLSIQNDRLSPGSATLEDVLASLLGLPSDSFAGDTAANTNDQSCDSSSARLQVDVQLPRRRSEGDAQKRDDITPNDSPSQRRVSLDSSESKSATAGVSSNVSASGGDVTKCRYPKCEASTSNADARKHYKSCHNCSHMYCSRECRRAHWEKHRKACLHSRVSVLCRQVLSSCKDDADTLKHLSILARRGFLTQGRGVVRILFRSPESAEMFVKQGFQRIGEASYVRWPELMPQEMGPELYSELLRLSTEYKPESKMLIYVAICVVSEAPSNATASVKWERQLVSRCAKLKLSKAIPSDLTGPNATSAAAAATNSPMPTTNVSSAISAPTKTNSNVLILTFNLALKCLNTPKNREIVLQNIQLVLKRRGVNLRKHYPEIFQRLMSFVEGTTERFLPVTIHPRDTITGQSFICIIMPNLDESDRIKLPESDNGNAVESIDCLNIDPALLID